MTDLKMFSRSVSSQKQYWFWMTGWIMAALSCFSNSPLWAGGGPENLILVVNADSSTSKMIANHFIAGRQIPLSHVIFLNGIPDQETIEFPVFLDSILKPILQQINDRKLAASVDYIVYSADFPTIVNIPDFRTKFLALTKGQQPEEANVLFGGQASISALTYFAPYVLTDQAAFMKPDANTYFRNSAQVILERPFVGPQQQAYQEAIKKFDDEASIDSAIKTLEDLANKNPLQVAVIYQLARFHARKKDAKQATQWLTNAIRAGWSFQKHTQDDPAFKDVKDDPLFKGIVKRIKDLPFDYVPVQGFKHTHSWGINGYLVNEPGQGNQYFLSTVLAATRTFGNSEKEALQQLQLTMKADFSKPKGTFYFSKTEDVRSTTRQPQFPMAVNALKRLGHDAKIIDQVLPMQHRDVLGLTTGTPKFVWTESGSKIVPGAICENLTSFGGILEIDSQTLLTEFLRHFAAGSSGTVTEPFAVPFKFPNALIHAHYASGCSLAEAYYQSVQSPFQLLIVGDPLCQPFATPPEFKVSGIKPNEKISGTVKVKFEWGTEIPIAGFEMYVDGVMVHRGPRREVMGFDTKGLSDGRHELRYVAVANNPIQTTQRVVIPFEVSNSGQFTTLETKREKYLETDKILIKAKTNFGDSIELRHQGRPVAKKIGRDVEFEIAASLLGNGPVQLDAVAIDEEKKRVVASPMLRLEIEGLLAERARRLVNK